MRDRYLLTDADRNGNAVAVRCGLCMGRRYYRPTDLIKLFGDIDCYLAERRMICETCGRSDYLRVRIRTLVGEELGRARFRRLKRIRTVRLPVWEDE